MRKTFSFNSTHFKNICIGIFFIVLSFAVVDLKNYSKQFLTDTKNETISLVQTESNDLRRDVFDYLKGTNVMIDGRLASIQRMAEVRLTSVEGRADDHLSTIEARSFKTLDNFDRNLTRFTDESIQLSGEYKKVPQYLKLFDKQLDCKTNDFCWQNLATDTLISTRNVSIDANKTFLMLNDNVPIWTDNFTKVSSSLATGFPVIVDNTGKITQNLNKLSKPSLMNRVMSWGVAGSMIYLNIRR